MRRYAAFAVLAIVLVAGLLLRLARLPALNVDPRWYTLGSLARELAREKQPYDVVVDALGGQNGTYGLITDEHKAFLRAVFSRGEYDVLDQQPQLTLPMLSQGLQLLASKRGPAKKAEPTAPTTEPLGLPTGKPGLSGEPYLKKLTLDFTWGDHLDPEKAARAADSHRLADVLDRVALGTLTVESLDMTRFAASFVETLTAQGHTVEVDDQRLAANFGDLERFGKPVATPLWVITGKRVGPEPFMLPVPHAQLELTVRGPKVNADVTFYSSLDLTGEGGGGARFRADVTQDQAWTGGFTAHRYQREQAVRALELMLAMRGELQAKVDGHALPLDGYFTLGVCTLAPAVVEQALTQKTTLWPLTHDPQYFQGGSELDGLVRSLPHDGRDESIPSDERLVGSLPWRKLPDVPFKFLARELEQLSLLKET
ncbi:MAG: hypothetical protein IPJ65_26520 [Archangiaceae bacterium]|nr:hypothetical protein [Archangiaceae bacterium]